MKIIPLTKGYVAYVSDQDYARVKAAGPWHASISEVRSRVPNVYAKRDLLRRKPRTTQYLHRFIMGVTDRHIEVDHRDHDGLNCRRGNLPIATSSQNKCNARLRSDNTLGSKGLSKTPLRKWRAQIFLHGKYVGLGTFETKREAIRARNRVAKRLHGTFAFNTTQQEAA